MNSALYTGQLRHRRFAPSMHEFRYGLFMLYVDLAELPEVFRGRWLWSTQRAAPAWLRRQDYLGPASLSIDAAVRACVMDQTGVRPSGPIRMLTHLRYFGLCFNPVTFYYCFGADGAQVESIVAEITNTPWAERHTYVLRDDRSDRFLRFQLQKQFHVSPFMPMEIAYDWRFSTPGDLLTVHMQSFQAEQKCFDATLELHRREIGAASLAGALLRYPCMTARVLSAIYWQALRLKLKGTPFHAHPRRNSTNADLTGAQH